MPCSLPLLLALLALALSCGGSPRSVPAAAVAAAPATQPTNATTSDLGPPVTVQEPVTDVYHGVRVADPYRWLEADGDARVKAWSAAQNAYTRRVLDALPDRAAIAARMQAVFTTESPSYKQLLSAGGQWFVLIAAPPRQQPYLAVMPAGGEVAQARVLLDPAALDPSAHSVIDFFVPSPDGARVAVSLSQNGTEAGDVRVIDVQSGEAMADRVPRVHGGTAGGDLVWQADGEGFFYTRYPAPGERPPQDLGFFQQLYFHALGQDPASDRYELGQELPRIAEIRLQLDTVTGRLLANVQNGDGGEFAHYLREPGGAWRKLSDFADPITHVTFAPGQRLLAVSLGDAPRGRLLVASAKAPDLRGAKVLIPESDAALVTRFWDGGALAVSARRIYLTYQLGGPSFVRVFDLQGKPLPWQDPLEVAAVAGLTRDGPRAVLLRSQSFVAPAAWYRFDEARAALSRTQLAEESPVAPAMRVVREQATSKDGTRVPFSVLVPASAKQDGSGPCLATGYGGYGLSLEPRFRVDNVLWLEQGVCVAVANLRGGSEFGESWHRQGMREHKQNVFDDFFAVLEQLVARGYTSPARLGILGGSNGGLLMGATLVQQPTRVRAVVSWVGIYDSLREELAPNGAFNVTEFGSVRDPLQFAALHAYSPYHHVTDGVSYPATLLLTGENDPRVGPMQTRKMAARLQAANAGSAPILFRSELAGGHGSDLALDEKVAEKTDVSAFMLAQLGVRYAPPRAAPP